MAEGKMTQILSFPPKPQSRPSQPLSGELNIEKLRNIVDKPEYSNLPFHLVSLTGEKRAGSSFLTGLLISMFRHLEKNGSMKWLESDVCIDETCWKRSRESVTKGVWVNNEPIIVPDSNGKKVAVLFLDCESLNVQSPAPNQEEIDAIVALLSVGLANVQLYSSRTESLGRFCSKLKSQNFLSADLPQEYDFTLSTATKFVKQNTKFASNLLPLDKPIENFLVNDFERDMFPGCVSHLKATELQPMSENLIFVSRDWENDDQLGLRPDSTSSDDGRADNSDNQHSEAFKDMCRFMLPTPGRPIRIGDVCHGTTVKDFMKDAECEEFLTQVQTLGETILTNYASQPKHQSTQHQLLEKVEKLKNHFAHEVLPLANQLYKTLLAKLPLDEIKSKTYWTRPAERLQADIDQLRTAMEDHITSETQSLSTPITKIIWKEVRRRAEKKIEEVQELQTSRLLSSITAKAKKRYNALASNRAWLIFTVAATAVVFAVLICRRPAKIARV